VPEVSTGVGRGAGRYVPRDMTTCDGQSLGSYLGYYTYKIHTYIHHRVSTLLDVTRGGGPDGNLERGVGGGLRDGHSEDRGKIHRS